MCASCGCGLKDKKMAGYGKGAKAGKTAKKAAPVAKKAAMNRKKGM
jgi:hypothetical protein